ncbi:MAG: hypothetical protein JST54_23430 [Deltaproteobacteria bacterium]|nr:hypothetical protein [Deltaproteobacteria bacterium]
MAVALGALVLVAAGLLLRDAAGTAEAVTGAELDAMFPAYPGTELFSMGEAGAVNGEPLRLAYFTARATPAEVSRFYESFWRSKKLMVDGEGNADALHLSALDGVDGTLRSVSGRREGDRMVVFCSVSRPGHQKAQADDELPRFTDAVLEDRIDLDGATTLTYVLNGTTVEAHQAELSKRFTAKGWKSIDDQLKHTPHGVVLQFEKNGRVAMAALAREPENQSVAVQIHSMTADMARGGTESP